MNLDHVTAFTAAMQHKNLEAMLSHMADDAVLNTPLIAEPIKGKAAIPRSSNRCSLWLTRSISARSCTVPSTYPRSLRSRLGQPNWTVWIIGSLIAPG